MARLYLITGGSRSGKSRRALAMGNEQGKRRVFVATCPHLDTEMESRIRRHVAERQIDGWQTHEEQLDLAGALAPIDADVVIVDCLTLWVNNLMYDADTQGEQIDEDDITRRCQQLLTSCRQRTGSVILVTNEVGLGVVPDNALARRFRDLAGRCNQTIAADAEDVLFMVSGLPLVLKKAKEA